MFNSTNLDSFVPFLRSVIQKEEDQYVKDVLLALIPRKSLLRPLLPDAVEQRRRRLVPDQRLTM
jgi:hypothetical protein